MSAPRYIATAVASAAVGVAGTYFYVTKQLRTKLYAEAYIQAAKDIEASDEYMAKITEKLPEEPNHETVIALNTENVEPVIVDAEDAELIIARSGYRTSKYSNVEENIVVEEDEEEIVAVLETVEGVRTSIEFVDQPEEDEFLSTVLPVHILKERSGDIYIITKDEFFEDDSAKPVPIHAQNTLTWYEKDSTLTDENDMFLDNSPKIIGKTAVKNFGVGTDEPHIVYVRNVRLNAEYEIVQDPGSYRDYLLEQQNSSFKRD